MAKQGRVRCGRWDGRRGARCGRVLRDTAMATTDRLQPHEKGALRAAVRDFAGAWWHVTGPVALASERDRDRGRIVTRSGAPVWVTTCACGVCYALPAGELRARTGAALAANTDVYLNTADRDAPNSHQ